MFECSVAHKLASLVDVTEIVNYLNASDQGKDKLIHNVFGEIRAFEAKLKLWQSQLHLTEYKLKNNSDCSKP